MSEATQIDNSIENPSVLDPSYSVVSFKGRELPSQYRHLLFSRWLRSLRYGNQLFRKMSSNEYYKNYAKFVENLIDKPGSLIRFAVLSDDHDVVLGFSVSREDVLDYVHVHTDYRRIGIARHLVPRETTTFSHLTATGIVIWQTKPKYKHLKFNPFA